MTPSAYLDHHSADLLSRLPGASEKQIAILDALALLGSCRRDERVKRFEIIVVVRVDFTVANAGQSIRNNLVLSDSSSLRERAN
ncbi:MAG: hypothetical protein NTV51_20940, partial [Verrucomicrobia bacterium]|nr:hypothetical protein [Verrucomicrobiota bacterium]